MFAIKTSISSGIKRGFAEIFSIFLSNVLLVLLAWCGLATVINSIPVLINGIRRTALRISSYSVFRRYVFFQANRRKECGIKSSTEAGMIDWRGYW
ncbi:TPA: LysE family transporter [Enterobacter cloacae]